MTERTYRIQEFSQLAGVTVRALHHYDKIGLLRPRRTRSGYRTYSSKDLEILEQIVALKFIGLPLNQIKPLLRRNGAELLRALSAQRTLLERKKRLLDQAIAAIGEVVRTMQGGEAPAGMFTGIIEVIEMQNRNEEWKKEYDALVQGKIEALKSMSPETRARLQTEWTQLLKDVEQSLNEDPAGAAARRLADRWTQLLGSFVPQGGTIDPQLLKKFGAADQPGGEWPASMRKPEGLAADRRIWDFIRRALAVRH